MSVIKQVIGQKKLNPLSLRIYIIFHKFIQDRQVSEVQTIVLLHQVICD